jgi:hypothetical protein
MFGIFEAQILEIWSESGLLVKTPVIIVSVISALITNCAAVLPLLRGGSQKLFLILSPAEDIQ